jgi:probable rRNA maturation factor
MIYIDNRQEKFEVTNDFEKTLQQVIDYTIKKETDLDDYQVSMIFVDNEEIKNINNVQRNIDKETDVLSFPMLEYDEEKVYKECYLDYDFDDSYFDEDSLVLGDIVLSLEKVEQQSREFNHSFIREAAYLTVHSVLHLLGYDHMDEDDKIRMRKKEEELLNGLKIFRE